MNSRIILLLAIGLSWHSIFAQNDKNRIAWEPLNDVVFKKFAERLKIDESDTMFIKVFPLLELNEKDLEIFSDSTLQILFKSACEVATSTNLITIYDYWRPSSHFSSPFYEQLCQNIDPPFATKGDSLWVDSITIQGKEIYSLITDKKSGYYDKGYAKRLFSMKQMIPEQHLYYMLGLLEFPEEQLWIFEFNKKHRWGIGQLMIDKPSVGIMNKKKAKGYPNIRLL